MTGGNDEAERMETSLHSDEERGAQREIEAAPIPRRWRAGAAKCTSSEGRTESGGEASRREGEFPA